MKILPYSFSDAYAYIKENMNCFPYALITSYSDVTLDAAEIPKDWAQVAEARFFGEAEEMHFYRTATELEAVLIKDEDNDTVIDCKAELTDKFPGKLYPGELYLREYLGFDEDGQGYISCVRLTRLERTTYGR